MVGAVETWPTPTDEAEMPATSEKQRRFMGAELARKRAGKKTRTGMNEGQLEDFASNPGEAQSARQQLHGLETAEPPDSADDLDRAAARRKKKKEKHRA